MAEELIDFIQIGVGNRGAQVLDEVAARHGDRFMPVAFVDVDDGFVAAAREKHGTRITAHAALADALVVHPEAQAVFVVTPARFHGEMVRTALEANRHVWVEKPLTYDYPEALALAALARELGRTVVVGNQYQYHPLERQLQELVASARYGRAFFLSYQHHRHRPQMRAFTGEYPALWEQGVHSLDSALAILGHPDLASVYALGQRPPHSAYNSDTVTNVLTQFANGVQVHLLVTFDSQRSDWSIRVECEHAALLLTAEGWDRSRIEVLAGEQVVETILREPIADSATADPYAAFHTAITTARTTPTSIEANVRTIQWIDAAVRSLRAGGVVRLGATP
jgi:predicted dehydrogenase